MKRLLAAFLILAASQGWALTRIQRNPVPNESNSRGPEQAAPIQRTQVTAVPATAAPVRADRTAPVHIERQRDNRPANSAAVEPRPGGNPGRTRIIRTPPGAPRSTYSRNQPRHYKEHVSHGRRYRHYHHRGADWYGFPYRNDYYWYRLHAGRWWWYDTGYSRWVYWNNGSWFWPGPHGVNYLYIDNYYRPYEMAEDPVEPEYNPEPAPVAVPSSLGVTSPDGTREVQVIGASSQAFLYERNGSTLIFMKFLGENIRNVRYTGGADGRPLRILLDFRDGAFALFDREGNPVEGAAAAEFPVPPTPPQP